MKNLNFIERQIVKRLINTIMINENRVSIYFEGDIEINQSTNRADVKAVIGDCDETEIVVHDKAGNRLGWIHLVHGNDWDVISDYSLTLEELIKPVNDWVDSNAS